MAVAFEAMAGVGWKVSFAIALVFLATIIGLYDQVLHATWHEPLALKLWNELSE